jgi:ribosomal protein S27E
MIKLRVEWHLKCRECGTELVSDFFTDSAEGLACPWCGCMCSPNGTDAELRDYIQNAVNEIEDKANGMIFIQS